jgi:hypothetical protein
MYSLTLVKVITLIISYCSEVFQHVTKATTGTGSKPVRETPFASWLQEIHGYFGLQ